MALDILRLVAGLIILIVAADRLVISAVRIAKVLNISVVIIGAVIVGFGTSVPEFVVSGLASAKGDIGLAMSNVVASNTSNITLVLGVAALLHHLLPAPPPRLWPFLGWLYSIPGRRFGWSCHPVPGGQWGTSVYPPCRWCPFG